ncbi:MAG: hypothetical protein ABIV51_09430 [Saprospiraceae bacterium]
MRNLFLFIFFCVLGNFSYSCTCIGEASVKRAIKESNIVLVGKIVKSEQFSFSSKWDIDSLTRIRYFVEVKRIYKGRVKKQIIEIITGNGNGDCGFEFKVGQEYVIYLDFKKRYFEKGEKVPRYLYTDICKRTCEVNDFEINEIGKHCNFFGFKN